MVRATSVPAPAGERGIVANVPNAARLFKSLRDSGYSNDTAVADFVDNSIDGEASSVQIFIEPATGRLTPDTTRVIVADDGVGMSAEELRESLKLGTESAHDLASDLGKYGMGLITASISMGRRLVVLTKTADGTLLRGVHDIDLIVGQNAFIAEIDAATDRDAREWKQYAISQDHGTIVVTEHCDQLSYANAGAFINRLKKHLGQVFRLFITAKSKRNGDFRSFLTINGDPVYAIDPLMLQENAGFLFPKTLDLWQGKFAEPVDDFAIEVPIDVNDAQAGTDTIRVRIVNLPELGQTLSRELEINAPNEGFYVMRNQREIAAAQTLGVFAKAQNLTEFRAELHVPASLDRRIGINWTKHRVEPDDALRELLKRRVGPHVSTIRKRYTKKTAETSKTDHKAYEALISKKAKLLSLPKARRVVRQLPSSKRGAVEPQGTDIRRTGHGELSDRVRDRCEFREAHMTASGPLWEPEMIGPKIVVVFNVDHPLWVRFVLDRKELDDSGDEAVVELLHLFAFCLSSAEFNVFGDEQFFERLVNMRQDLSNNMRVLLT